MIDRTAADFFEKSAAVIFLSKDFGTKIFWQDFLSEIFLSAGWQQIFLIIVLGVGIEDTLDGDAENISNRDYINSGSGVDITPALFASNHNC